MKQSIRAILFILTVLLCSNQAKASSSADLWYGFFTKSKLGQGFSVWNETQLRFDLSDQFMQQILARSGVLKKLSGSSEIGALYAYIQSGQSKEHRLTAQHVQKYGMLGQFKLSHRVRLEYRTLEDSSNPAGRFRYLFRAEQSNNGKTSLVIWDEAFVNLTKQDGFEDQIFERNRAFIGLRLKKLKGITPEIGYLNQYVPRPSQDSWEHIVALYTFF